MMPSEIPFPNRARAYKFALPPNINQLAILKGFREYISLLLCNPCTIETPKITTSRFTIGEAERYLVSDGELDDFDHDQQKRNDQVPAHGQHPHLARRRPDRF
jgi:hypothetical protein